MLCMETLSSGKQCKFKHCESSLGVDSMKNKQTWRSQSIVVETFEVIVLIHCYTDLGHLDVRPQQSEFSQSKQKLLLTQTNVCHSCILHHRLRQRPNESMPHPKVSPARRNRALNLATEQWHEKKAERSKGKKGDERGGIEGTGKSGWSGGASSSSGWRGGNDGGGWWEGNTWMRR